MKYTYWFQIIAFLVFVFCLFKEGLQGQNQFCAALIFPIDRVLLKVEKYHKVSNLMLKWGKWGK